MADEQAVTPDPKDQEIEQLKAQLANLQAQQELTNLNTLAGPPAPTRPPSAFVQALAPQAAQPAQPSLDDQITARIMALLGGQLPAGAAPAPQPEKPLSPEDQRLLVVLSRVYPTSRDVVIKQRYPAGTNLSVVELAHTPNTGSKRDTEVLVFDNGSKTFVFGAI